MQKKKWKIFFHTFNGKFPEGLKITLWDYIIVLNGAYLKQINDPAVKKGLWLSQKFIREFVWSYFSFSIANWRGKDTETITLLCLMEFQRGVITLVYDKIAAVEHIRLRIIKKLLNQRVNLLT